ncbi:MAG: hypothetical protein R2702_08375 [Acidimicrobiales bacterium]
MKMAPTPTTSTPTWRSRSRSASRWAGVAASTARASERSAGRVMAPATTTSGMRTRNTARHESACSIPSAAAGPARPGTTQAVDMTANILGRSTGGMPRAMAA